MKPLSHAWNSGGKQSKSGIVRLTGVFDKHCNTNLDSFIIYGGHKSLIKTFLRGLLKIAAYICLCIILTTTLPLCLILMYGQFLYHAVRFLVFKFIKKKCYWSRGPSVKIPFTFSWSLIPKLWVFSCRYLGYKMFNRWLDKSFKGITIRNICWLLVLRIVLYLLGLPFIVIKLARFWYTVIYLIWSNYDKLHLVILDEADKL